MAARYWPLAGIVLSVLLICVATVMAAPMEATVILGRDPEPPMVMSHGGVLNIAWDIEHSTTPDHVYYKLEDPSRTTILEQQTYMGGTGISVARQWDVPVGAVGGKYWVRVEYWSVEAGNEANAEVTFCVDFCGNEVPVPVTASTWGVIKSMYR